MRLPNLRTGTTLVADQAFYPQGRQGVWCSRLNMENEVRRRCRRWGACRLPGGTCEWPKSRLWVRPGLFDRIPGKTVEAAIAYDPKKRWILARPCEGRRR